MDALLKYTISDAVAYRLASIGREKNSETILCPAFPQLKAVVNAA